MDWVVCPECAHPAEVTWRGTTSGTDSGAEYAKVHCLRRHWFLLPSERLLAWPSTLAS
jgi:hypothetical protein